MGKGFLFGIVFGAIFAAMSLSAVSLMAPPVGSRIMIVTADPVETPESAAEAPTTPDVAIVEVPAGSEFARPQAELVAILPATEPVPATAVAPEILAPLPEPAALLAERNSASVPAGQSQSPIPMAAPDSNSVDVATLSMDQSPSAAPEGQPSAPALVSETASVDTAPVIDAPAATTIAPTQVDPSPSAIAAETSAPQAPSPRTAGVVEELPDVVLEIATAQPEPAADSLNGAPVAAPMAVQQPVDAAVDDTLALPPSAPTVPNLDPVLVTQNDQPAPETTADIAPEPQARVAQALLPEPAPILLDANPNVPAEPFGSATAPQPGFTQSVPGVRINRLPSIGSEGDAAQSQEPATQPETEVAESSSAEDLPAIVNYAALFDNTANLPLFAMVILDVGPQNGGVDASELAGLALPVTIAVSPEATDPTSTASSYRSAGFEVALLLPEQPAGATASDLEVSYQSHVLALPESAVLIGAPDAAFQTDRRVAQHLVSLLAADGRGLVTYSLGLNPAKQAADKAGVPNSAVYRVVDVDHESAATIARYLDRAAFEAHQKGQIVVVAHSYPETLEALKIWAASGAKGTAIAPVSAAMLAQPIGN